MKPINIISCLFILSIVLFACKSNKYTIDNLPTEQLQFGSSGGVAGITTTHILLENGQVFFRKNKNAALEKKNSRRKKVGKQQFKKAAAINWEELPVSEPGNMNYYIKWKKGAGEELQYMWSGQCPDPTIAEWFNELNDIVRE